MIEIIENYFGLTAEDTFPAPRWYFQQTAWVQNPLDPENVAYNYPLALRMRGPLDQMALKRSIREIVRRHQVLRSAFRIQDGHLLQIVQPPRPLTFPIVDLSKTSEAEREAKVLQLAIDDANRPFNLNRSPLLRAKLLRINPEDHLLLLTTHHLVSDDWSMRILLRELSLVYGAFKAGQPSPLTDISFQYGDFVRQEQKRLEEKKLDHVAFWKQQLDGGNDFHHLAPDHIRAERQTYRGTHERTTLAQSRTNALKTLCRQEKVTPFMALLGALQCLLSRYSGHQDIGVATCVANRSSSQTAKLVGHFSNHVILRGNLGGNPTFRELLRRVREVTLTAYSYQNLPFGSLVEELAARSSSSANRPFQVLLVLTDAPRETWSFPGLNVSPFPIDLGTTAYDLIVWLSLEKSLEIDVQYNSDLFEVATIRKILEDYGAVLEAMSKSPQARVDEVAIARLQAPSDSQLRREHTSKERAYPTDTIESQLVELWEAVLEKRPIGIHDDFFELGGSSLLATRLFAKIKEVFELKFPLVTLIKASTIEKLAKLIRQPASCDTRRSLVSIQPGDSRPPLFCVHGESGNLLMYRALGKYLGADQPVYGLQPQGLDCKQPPLTRIEDMAANYIEEIRAVQAEGPYSLVGYCMGGTIALEMTQQLRRQGKRVGLLALSDTYNWRRARRTLLSDLYFNLQTWWFGCRHFLLRGSRNKLNSLRVRFNAPCGKSELSECNRRGALSYVPTLYPGRILHVRPRRQYTRYNGPELGWSKLAASLEVFHLPTYPGRIFEEPYIKDLATKLRACITACITEPAAKWNSAPETGAFERGLNRRHAVQINTLQYPRRLAVPRPYWKPE